MINNNLGSLFKGNIGRIYRGKQFIFYKNNASIFKTYIEIDSDKAKNLNLSYFKTVTIYKKQNSYLNQESNNNFLINEEQKFDIKNYLSNNYVNEKYNLLDKSNNFLGRSLKISESFSKNQIENYTIRNSKDYFFGINMYIDNQLGFTISNIQEIFFQTSFNIRDSISANENYNTILILYAFDENDNILDIKKIENFIPRNIVNWAEDYTTKLSNFDEIDFENLLNISFDNVVYNNLIRKMNISKTSLYNDLLNRDTNPIESIAIQENNNDIEEKNSNIKLLTDNTEVFFNTNLSNISTNDEIKYNIYIKITGSNKYYILQTSKKIINNENINLISIQNNINDYLKIESYYLHKQQLIQIKIKVQKENLNDKKFNPTFSGIFFNNIDSNKNLIDNVFLVAIGNDSNENISLNGELLRNILNDDNSEYSNFTFYLKTNYNFINKIYFTFEQNFEKYNTTSNVSDIFEETVFNQSLSIQNISKNDINYSNLNINYNLKIENYKNNNYNLNKLIYLNYDSIYIDQLKQNTEQYKQTFDNNIFVIIRKRITQAFNNNNKERYYIFNKDIINNLNLNTTYTEDISLDLTFNDNEQLNQIFNIQDKIDKKSPTVYEFSAKIMVIPLDFFSTNVNEFQMKEKIKQTILLNNFKKSMPNYDELNVIYNILFNINKNSFSSLRQYDLYKLFNDYCFSESFATNSINLSKIYEENIFKQNIILEYDSFNFNLDNFNLNNSKKDSKIIFSTIFNLNKNIDNIKESLKYFENIVTGLFESFYYIENNKYIDIFTLKNIGFQKREIIEKINDSLIKKYDILNNTLQIDLSLVLKKEISTFFRDIISLSENSDKNKNFLKKNFYIKLNFENVNTNKIDISIKNVDDIFVKFPLY